MMNCEKASKLTSKKIDVDLSFWEGISLKFHTLICSTCGLFEVEANTLTKTLTHNKHEHKDYKTMSKESKSKLQDLLVLEKK